MFIIQKLIDFFNNKVNSEKISCKKCKGSGIVDLDNPIICKNCNGKICYLCENKGPVQLMKECELCCGEGLLII